MANRKAIENSELKNRFDHFHREARYQSQPYRLLGKPQVTGKQVSVLIAYPADEKGSDKAVFAETVGNELKTYGLDPVKVVVQKSAVRIQVRLLVAAPDAKENEA